MSFVRTVIVVISAAAVVAVAAFVWGLHDERRTAHHNEAAARTGALSAAHAFERQARAAAAHPFTRDSLLGLGRSSGTGMVSARQAGADVVLTFEVNRAYAAPGATMLGSVSVCYQDTLARSGTVVTDTLAPLSCARIPLLVSDGFSATVGPRR